MSTYDLILTDLTAVLGHEGRATIRVAVDIGVKDGKIVALEAGSAARRRPTGSSSAGGKVAFPGVVDGHQHWGIYNPLRDRRDVREPRVRAGRRDDRAELHADRAVLPEQGRRRTPSSSPRCCR